MAMPKEKQEAMKKECQDAAMSKPHAEFCANVQALWRRTTDCADDRVRTGLIVSSLP